MIPNEHPNSQIILSVHWDANDRISLGALQPAPAPSHWVHPGAVSQLRMPPPQPSVAGVPPSWPKKGASYNHGNSAGKAPFLYLFGPGPAIFEDLNFELTFFYISPSLRILAIPVTACAIPMAAPSVTHVVLDSFSSCSQGRFLTAGWDLPAGTSTRN